MLTLQKEWEKRLKLHAEGKRLWAEDSKLRAESDRLYLEGNKIYAEGYKLRMEGCKLYAEGCKLYAESNEIWACDILRAFGNITLEWQYRNDDYDCLLGNGELYKHDC